MAQKLVLTVDLNGQQRTISDIRAIRQEIDRLDGSSNATAGSADRLASGLSGVAIQFNALVSAAQTLVGVLRPAFDALITSNEQLNQQILSTQASLVATNQVFRDGIEIGDSTEAIQALAEPVEEALKQVRLDSERLVGVTSDELIPLFQILATNAGAIADQSEEFADPIAAAGKLTIDFAAALGTLSIPLDQARQEINSILQGQVNMDSQLASQLGLQNEQIRRWKEQGVLVDELRNSLEAFTDANALQAQSVGGATSNIAEVFQEVARIAGEPIFDELVNALVQIEELLKANRDIIQEFADEGAEEFLAFARAVVEASLTIGEALAPAIQTLSTQAADGAQVLVDGFVLTAQAAGALVESLTPVLQLLGNISIEASRIADIARETIGFVTAGGRDDQEVLETLTASTRALSAETESSVNSLRDAIAARNAAQEEGIELTDEERRRQQAQIRNADSLIASLELQRDALIEARRGTVDTDVREELSRQADAIDDAIVSIEEEQSALRQLGAEIELVSRQSQDFAQAQRLIKTETREAKEAIEEAKLAEIESQNTTNDLLNSGAISAEEAQERRLNATLTRIEAELEAEREKLQELLSIDTSGIDDDEQRAEIDAAIRQSRLAIAGLSGELGQQQAEIERNTLQARVDAIEESTDDAIEAIRASETERLIAQQEFINIGKLSQEQAAAERLQITRDRIEAELQAERDKFAELQAIEQPNNPEEREALERQIRASAQRTADLTLDLLETEQRQREELAQQAIQQIRERTATVERSNQRELASLEAFTNGLQRQNDLLSAQSRLRQAQAGLADAESGAELSRLQRALQLTEQIANEDDARVRQVLNRQLAELGVGRDRQTLIRQIADEEQEQIRIREEAFEREAEFRRQQLDIELRLAEAAAQRLLIESQLAQVQAQSQIAQAEQIVDPAERERALQAARLQAELADNAAINAQENADAQSDNARLSREALEADLEREEIQLETASLLERQNVQLREAEQLTRNISQNLQGTGGFSLNSIPGRRTGGPLEAGQMYRVHGNETLVTSPTPGFVLNRKDTMAIASQSLGTPAIPGIGGISASSPVIGAIQALSQQLSGLNQPGVNVGALNSPMYFSLDRDSQKQLQVVQDAIRQWERNIVNTRSFRYGR